MIPLSSRRWKHLGKRERMVVMLSAMYASGRRQQADRVIREGISLPGVTKRFLEELFIHLSLVLGFPAMLDGLERLRRLGISASSSQRIPASGPGGMKPLSRVYGRQTGKLLRNLQQLHPEVRTWILRDVYGRVFTRTGMRLRERELINVVVLAVQGLDRQLQSHVRGALRAGISRNALREAFSMTGSIVGRPKIAAKYRPLVVSLRKNS